MTKGKESGCKFKAGQQQNQQDYAVQRGWQEKRLWQKRKSRSGITGTALPASEKGGISCGKTDGRRIEQHTVYSWPISDARLCGGRRLRR